MKTRMLLCIWVISFAYAEVKSQIIFPAKIVQCSSATAIETYLRNTYTALQDPDFQLKAIFYKSALASKHYTYQVLYKQIPILDASIKVNTDLSGKVLSSKMENVHSSNLSQYQVEDAIQHFPTIDFSKIIEKEAPIQTRGFKLDCRGQNPQLIYQADFWNKSNDKTYLFNLSGQLIEIRDQLRYIKKDSLIDANIFRPDPLTSIAQIYGTPYVDSTDINLPWFAPAYFATQIPATFETTNNTFYLENALVVIEDFESPNIPVVTGTTPNFNYNRSEGGFEQCNALYHISTFHDYISSLGYDTIMDIPITVDAQGMLGADNSKFNRNGGDPTLSFGTGGVDDAEDADVIIHEYSHALSWSANNNTFSGVQRMGLDEGLADYFATSYSRAINPFDWQKVFSWDGNNEFWAGRTAVTAVNYPNGAGLYGFGEIWNAAMSAIWTDLGQIVTDKLMLEALHFFTDGTTLPEAAIYVMQSDTLLFAGMHANTICTHFKNKNILDANCLPVSTIDVVKAAVNNGIEIRNTYGFTFLNETAEIQFDALSNGTYSIYNVAGLKIADRQFANTSVLKIVPGEFASGVYFIRVRTLDLEKTFKIVK